MATQPRPHIVPLGFLLVVLIGAGNAVVDTVFMDSQCDSIIQAGDSGGNMDSQATLYYDDNVDCTVTITASIGRRLLLTFDRVDIVGTPDGTSSDCDGDYLEIYDAAATTVFAADRVVCGSTAEDFVSSSFSVTLRLVTDSTTSQKGFYLSFTSFTTSDFLSCGHDEFQCDNDRCIDEDLANNLYDNCGDNSDEGFLVDFGDTINKAIGLGIGIIVAIVIGCIVGVVLLCVCIGCICYHCCCKKSPAQQTNYQVVSQTPQQGQQPPMVMQPTAQPGAYPPGQQVYPPGQPGSYPPGQPVYPPGQPAGYPAGEKV